MLSVDGKRVVHERNDNRYDCETNAPSFIIGELRNRCDHRFGENLRPFGKRFH